MPFQVVINISVFFQLASLTNRLELSREPREQAMDSFKDFWIVICWFKFVYCGYVWSTIVEEGCIWTGR